MEGQLIQKPAFSLIELLVVVAILSIVAAVLIPVLESSRTRAQSDVCISNLHQISLATNLYLQDFDGYYPSFKLDRRCRKRAADRLYWHSHFCRGTHLLPDQITWVSLVKPYSDDSSPMSGKKKQSIFFCPQDSDRHTRPVTSYEFRMFLAEGTRSQQVELPANMIAYWEQWDYHDPVHYSEHDVRASLNVVFADGHALRLALSNTTLAHEGKVPDLHRELKNASGSAISDIWQDNGL